MPESLLPWVPALSAESSKASEQSHGGGKGARAPPLRVGDDFRATKESREMCYSKHTRRVMPARGERSSDTRPLQPSCPCCFSCGPWWPCRPSSSWGAAPQPHSRHPSLPCHPVFLPRAPSRSNQDCNCSRARLARLQLRLSGFPFWTEIVWCLSPTLTPPSQTSAARRSLGPCQPPLCQSLLPGPPSEPHS